MLKIKKKHKDFIWRLVRGDAYARKKFIGNFKVLAEDFFAKNVTAPKERLSNAFSVREYLNLNKRYSKNFSLFFDQDFYSEQVGVRFDSEESAILHYKTNFKNNGCNPHPLFDSNMYVAQIGNLGDLDPVSHFLLNPSQADLVPTPYVDVNFYKEKYPDLSNFREGTYFHFMMYGRGELRAPHRLFDPDYYLTSVKDVDWKRWDPLSHYVAKGSKLSFRPHPAIDIDYIRRQQKASAALKEQEPLSCYIRSGKQDGIEPNPLFNSRYYFSSLSQNGIELPSKSESNLAHFFRVNSTSKPVDPGPMFSSAKYWRNYPDIGSMDPFYHYLRYGRKENRKIASSHIAIDSVHVKPVMEIEPTILAPHQSAEDIWSTIYPNLGHPGYPAVKGMLSDIKDFAPNYVLLLSAFRRGGAERIALTLIDNILSLNSNAKILIVLTDQAKDEAAHWCPVSDRLRTTTLAHEPEINVEESTKILARFLELLRPDMVINCNSKIGWLVYRNYGRPLGRIMRLRASLFCYDFDVHGRKVGYARDYIRDTIEYLDQVFVDNANFKAALVRDFSLSNDEAKKIVVFYQLAKIETSDKFWPNLLVNAKNPKILWPMRFHRQKRPDVLRQIALAMQEVEFHVWAPNGTWDSEIAKGSKPDNVTMLPDSNIPFTKLDLSAYCGLLSTSQWEGLPTILIEGAVAGLPLICSDVGGVCEIATAQTAFVVKNFDNVAEYVNQIRELVGAPDIAENKRKAAFNSVVSQHGAASYQARLSELGFLSMETVRGLETRQNMIASVKSKARAASVSKSKKSLRADVAVIVNGHREGSIIIPTLRSVEVALSYARSKGVKCYGCVVLDRPDDATKQVVRENVPERWVVKNVDEGDLGLARNAAVILNDAAEYLAFVDGDDLISQNWLYDAFECASSWRADSVWHPGSNFIFGKDKTYVFNHRDTSDKRFAVDFLVVQNYWTALSFARRSIYLSHPYEKNEIRDGWGYEDWSWNARTIAEGIPHKIVPFSAHFVRRRANSLLTDTNARPNLPKLYPLREILLSDKVESGADVFNKPSNAGKQ